MRAEAEVGGSDRQELVSPTCPAFLEFNPPLPTFEKLLSCQIRNKDQSVYRLLTGDKALLILQLGSGQNLA